MAPATRAPEVARQLERAAYLGTRSYSWSALPLALSADAERAELLDSARRDFESALLLEPQNKLALEAVENYKSVLHRLVVLSKATPEVRSRQRKGL